MGIRMHLALGYGLMLDGADLTKLKDWEVLESREVFNSVLEDTKSNLDATENLYTSTSFIQASCLYDAVRYEDESGFADRLLLIPFPSTKEYHRYGDILDTYTYEAGKTVEELDMAPTWEQLPGTLYPYTNLMRANPDHPLGIEKYWVSCYLNHPHHKNAIPYAPLHLWYVMKALELWPEEELTERFLTLRPTLYRNWS